MRHLAECYARVLCAALDYQSESEEDTENWDDDGKSLSEDDLEFE